MADLLLFVLLVLFYGQIQAVQAQFSVALPLAVRSPYLSCWLPRVNGSDNAAGISPTRSDLSQTRDWDVLVRVDGTSYMILGSSVFPTGYPNAGNLTSLIRTNFYLASVKNTVVRPTQIILTAVAGPMQVNLTILNPIEPDLVKQSIPFSYISLTAISQDGLPHNMQVYSAIDGKWIAGFDPQLSSSYTRFTRASNIYYHIIENMGQNQVQFSDVSGQAGWGTLYFATMNESGITYTISDRLVSLKLFCTQGFLNDGRIVGPIGATTFAISRDLGTIQATQDPVVWAIGYTTDPAINFVSQPNSSQSARKPYYRRQYINDEAMMVDFLNDFTNASQRAQHLDQRILQDAASVSGSGLLGDLVSLAVPQVFGSLQLTIGTDANGNFDESDVMMFMKDVGGDNPNRVNAVETLYAAFPALMYIDPKLGALLLEPLFRIQAPPDIQYAPKDLGLNYPNATASMSTHPEGVEQTGNMLIMTYAHARATGDGSLINKYYSVLTSWADYLTNASLFNSEQSDSNGETVAKPGLSYTNNQTNLAIKGIIAIEVMSKLSSLAGREAQAQIYSKKAAQLYVEWKAVGLGSDQHLFAYYGDNSSWTLGYNLFADKWLGTEVVEQSVYDGHSGYINNIPHNTLHVIDQLDYDIPIQSTCHPDCYPVAASWNLFVAAMAQNISNNLSSNRIAEVYKRATLFGNQSLGIFPFRYTSNIGADVSGMANPAQGAMFAPLALTIPVKSINISTDNTTTPSTPRKASVAKPVIGALAALILVVGILAFILWRRRRLGLNMGESYATSSAALRSVSVIEIEVTPFTPTRPNAMRRDPEPWMEWQGSQLGPQSSSFVPIGLSSKELARIREENLHSQPAITHPESDESRPQYPPSPVQVVASQTELRTATTLPTIRTGQSQFDRLWRDISQFLVERLGSEAPPSYTEGDVRERVG